MPDVWDMNVRIWGGPKDGQVIRIPSDRREWTIAEPIPISEWDFTALSDGPQMKTTRYRITRSPYGLVAVHPSVDLKPLIHE